MPPLHRGTAISFFCQMSQQRAAMGNFRYIQPTAKEKTYTLSLTENQVQTTARNFPIDGRQSEGKCARDRESHKRPNWW